MKEISCVTGALVLYRQKPAKITAIAADGKIEIAVPDGERKSVRGKDITVLHRGPITQLPPLSLPSPDLMEIVSMLEGETLEFTDFASLVYGKFTPESAWASWQLLEQGIHFTGSIEEGVKARPETEIIAAQETIAAKENGKRLRDELIGRIRSGKLLPEDRAHLRDVENLALGKTAASGIMRDLNMEQTPEKAHRLLLSLKVWDHWINPFPSRAGIGTENPELPVPELTAEERLDLTAHIAWAIDDEGNQDPDDAIGFCDGLLWVHVADVAALVTPGSDIDLEAESRGANLYLPETIVHMLPPAVTRQLGLGLLTTSPALSFAILIDDEGEAHLEKIALSNIKVTRLSYEEAELRLEEDPLKPLIPLLERFRARRERNGALRIDLPEVKIKTDGKEVTIKPLPLLKSREMVAESMMAAGHAVATYAVARDIPLPFASQPTPDVDGKPETLAGMFAARRGCTVTSVQTSPGLHAGLGLDPYVRITSPLRRYGDLLAHQQMRLHLAGHPLMPATELDGKIAKSESAGTELRRLERISNEFWKLVYLGMHPGWQGQAIAVDRIDARLTMLLPDLAYEYKLRMGGQIELNSIWTAELNTVDLPGLTARFTLNQALT